MNLTGEDIQTLSIGYLCERYRLAPTTIRSYEERGDIPPACRTPGGHRRYGKQHIEVLDKMFSSLQKGTK